MNEAIDTAYRTAVALHPELTLDMVRTVIEAYEAAHRPFYLNHIEKSDIAQNVIFRSGAERDIVHDVFEEIAAQFIVRRREPEVKLSWQTEGRGQEG